MKKKILHFASVCLLAGGVATAIVTPTVVSNNLTQTLANKPNNLGLQPQFNIVNLPDDDKWNNATLGMVPLEPEHFVPGETDTSWTLKITKDFYTASFSVPNLDNFMNKYGENKYVTLKDCVHDGMVNPDFKFGFLYHNQYGSSDVPSIQLHESKYNFDTTIDGWSHTPIDSDNSTFAWKTNIDTMSLNPLLNENQFSIALLLTLYDANNKKANVYDAFETALVPDGMDDMFSLKIKDGYYFKWSGQYQFDTPQPVQNFDDWTFQGQRTKVLDRLSTEPTEQTFSEIVKPYWATNDNVANYDIALDVMYTQNKRGIIQRCELGEDTKQDNYIIKKVRLADLIRGIRADGSRTERATTDAWLMHYTIKINVLSYGDVNMPTPWVTQDASRHFWLNIPDFHYQKLLSPIGFIGTIDTYDNNDHLDYRFYTDITSQINA